MDFTVKWNKNYNMSFDFINGECNFIDCQNEPACIVGEIMIEDNCVGQIVGFELYNDESAYSKLDEISGDCAKIAEVICDDMGYIKDEYINEMASFENVFILDNITIEVDFRGKGIGESILKNLSKMLEVQFGCGENIFLCASDFNSAKEFGFESDEYKNGCKKLIKFYEKCGFKLIKDNVMVYNA